MWKKIVAYHEQIDIFFATLFLYFLLSFLFVCVFSFIENDYIHSALSVCLPLLFISNKKIRVKFNTLLHRVLGFSK